MTTAPETLRQRVFDNLYENLAPSRPQMDRLSASSTDGAGPLTLLVESPGMWSKGDIMEFDSGEQMQVWSTVPSGVLAYRGYNGTMTTTDHQDYPVGSLVRLNPKWTIKQVDDALREAYADMRTQGIYVVSAAEPITLVSGQDRYDITISNDPDDKRFIDPKRGVLSVYYTDSSTGDVVAVPFLDQPNAAVTDATIAHSVRLIHWGNQAAGDELDVLVGEELKYHGRLPWYQDPAPAWFGGIGTQAMGDAAVMYATGRLMIASEGARIHDPGRHTDRTVQPAQALRSGGFFLNQYQRAVWKLKGDLMQQVRNLPGASIRRGHRFRRG